MRKNCLIITMIIAFAIITTGTVFAQTSDIKVSVDGKLINFTDSKPLIKENRVWIPVRIVSESLGATVTFDPFNLNEKTIEIKKEDRYANIGIGSTLVFTNDDFPIDMRVTPYIENNRTMVPVRFISEALLYKVEWDDVNKEVKISTQD